MKAVVMKKFGGPDVLQIEDVKAPSPSANQVRIKVAATSVNRPDLVQRDGNYPPPPGESEILGLEVAGTIDQVGPDVHDWRVGDRVMTLVAGGGYAESAVAFANHLIPIPDSTSFEEAACVCEAYITAFLNVFKIGGASDGDYVLLHGGGGGVNTAAIQLCRQLIPEARLIVTASPGKIERVESLGVDLVINYHNQDFSEEIKTFTENQGVQVILDHVGGKYLAKNMKSLSVGGRLVVIGVTGGAKAELNLALMMVKRQQILGSVLRSRPPEEKGQIVTAFREVALPLFADRRIVPLIDRVYPLEDVAQAHRVMEASEHFGKIVLTIA